MFLTGRSSLRTFASLLFLTGFLHAQTPSADGTPAPAGRILLGAGAHTYEWVRNWIKTPPDMKWGPTHGEVCVDSKDRILFTTDSEHAFIWVDADGNLIKSFGKAWAGGVHGARIVKEGDRELLWFVHLKRHVVVKATLDGEVLTTLWCPPQKNDVYRDPGQFVPTAVDVAPNGDVYVVDGYGKGWLHVWNAKGEYVRSWNGAEGEAGPFKQPHGVGIDLRGPEPRVVVADRANHRLQVFTLDGKFIKAVYEELRRPSKVTVRGDDMVVVDLEGRVTIFDKQFKPVAQLGDNSVPELRGKHPVPSEKWKDGEFISPHGAAWDSQGNLYVEDWNATGRINKLRRVKP